MTSLVSHGPGSEIFAVPKTCEKKFGRVIPLLQRYAYAQKPQKINMCKTFTREYDYFFFFFFYPQPPSSRAIITFKLK